jgi:hypothetical protein
MIPTTTPPRIKHLDFYEGAAYAYLVEAIAIRRCIACARLGRCHRTWLRVMRDDMRDCARNAVAVARRQVKHRA